MDETILPLSTAPNWREPDDDPQANDRVPEKGIGLCLSGGGYRAMMFHTGALIRLNELGLLKKLARISCVSGGSIVGGVLGKAWKDLNFDANDVSQAFPLLVFEPIRKLASMTIDSWSVFKGLFDPFNSICDKINAAYEKHLFRGATLQDLPDTPRFVFNATNVQTGALWRFSKPYMGDYRTGLTFDPTLALSWAVTASSAFPPVLSPVPLDVSECEFKAVKGADLSRPPYTTRVVLSDGGAYDNLGLETVFKRYDTVLVSDAGAKTSAEEYPSHDWARHSYRMFDIVDNQVRSLRKRTLISAYNAPEQDVKVARKGAYWGIGSDILNFKFDSPLASQCPIECTRELAEVPTRLEEMTVRLQNRLINWGYAICDTAVRKHWCRDLPLCEPEFPYPESGV